jgi:hypothetical protein
VIDFFVFILKVATIPEVSIDTMGGALTVLKYFRVSIGNERESLWGIYFKNRGRFLWFR